VFNESVQKRVKTAMVDGKIQPVENIDDIFECLISDDGLPDMCTYPNGDTYRGIIITNYFYLIINYNQIIKDNGKTASVMDKVR